MYSLDINTMNVGYTSNMCGICICHKASMYLNCNRKQICEFIYVYLYGLHILSRILYLLIF